MEKSYNTFGEVSIPEGVLEGFVTATEKDGRLSEMTVKNEKGETIYYQNSGEVAQFIGYLEKMYGENSSVDFVRALIKNNEQFARDMKQYLSRASIPVSDKGLSKMNH